MQEQPEQQQSLLAFGLIGVVLLFLAACAAMAPTPDGPADSAAPAPADDAPFTVIGDANFPALALLVELPDGMPIDDLGPAPELPAQEPPPPTDLWDRLRAGFALPDHTHARVQPDLDWYVRHPDYLDRVAERASAYLYFVVESVEAREMPTEIALLPIVESAFHPFAYSHGRASGLWQFIPSTGRRYGLKQNWWYDGRRDVAASTRAALDYLQDLHRHFDGDWLLALAAYNSGEGTVMRAIRRNRARGKPTDFWSLSLPRETRGYVPKLLALANIVKDPAAHGLELTSIPDEPYFAKVDVGSQIDLALAAELAGLDMEEIYRLNPGFNRWATDPDGPHQLLLPLDRATDFSEALAKLPAEKRVSWTRHRIRNGETLGAIARRYHTTVATLQRVNKIRGHVIRAGAHLIIPVASRQLASYTHSADQRRRAAQNTPREGHKVVHVVDQGDTLWDLSRRHRVSVRALARWNAMAPTDPLVPGKRLVIWSRASQPGRLAALDAPPERSVTQRIGYRVRPGDSLARISQRFNVSISQLCEWNNLNRDRYLQPGQSLTLYVDVTESF